MSVDPLSIPQHVLDAAVHGYVTGALGSRDDLRLAPAIAAALTALMDDEPVTVEDQWMLGVTDAPPARVLPSEVLAAVLERETDR